jgi:hypothetical protein
VFECQPRANGPIVRAPCYDEWMIVRQHYVAAGYLARFTVGGERDSSFFVHSLDRSPVRQDIPDHIALERHYHTIDVPGLPADRLETIFQRFESPACGLFRTLSANPGRPFMTPEEFATAVEFLALQAARVPLSKTKFESLILDTGRRLMREVANSAELFESVASPAVRVGTLDPSVQQNAAEEHKSLKAAIESGELYVVADKSHIAVGMLSLAAAIFDQIITMNATLWYCEGPDWFVCSDHPVALFYSLPGKFLENPALFHDPKVELLSDSIYMPLARNVALVLHRHRGVPEVQRANRSMVALVNSLTVFQAQRWIFSATPDFVCRVPGGRVVDGCDAIDCLLSYRQAVANEQSA